MLSAETILILATAGIFGGILNAIAGGATLLTFPTLVFVGLPPVVANATNIVAMLPANAAAIPSCMQELKSVGRNAILKMVAISVVGAGLGSYLLVRSDNATFMFLVPYLIFFATALFAFSKQIQAAMTSKAFGRVVASGPAVQMMLLVLFAVYGGYFGAGLGVMLIAAVSIMGYSNYVLANGLKNLLACCFTLVSIGVLGFSGLIAFPEALIMMVSSAIGGYAGGHLSKRVNAQLMKRFIVCFGLCLGSYYLVVS